MAYLVPKGNGLSGTCDEGSAFHTEVESLARGTSAYAAVMIREHLRTPDEYMAAEFGRVMRLFGQALPTETDRTTFDRLMNEASEKGLNWIEGLEYAAARRPARLA